MTEGVEGVLQVITYIFATPLRMIWELITGSWILTAFLLMSIISTILLEVIPSDGSSDDK